MILIEETDERFYISDSTLPDAGKGLFAAVPIQKGDYLEIIGVHVMRKSITDACTHFAKTYKFAAEAGLNFDRHIIPLGFGAIVNHGPENIRNCELVEHRGPKKNPNAGKMVYMFTRDVASGEEVLGDYGGSYGVVLDWSNEFSRKYEEVKDEWEVFMSYDLYNIGVLKG